MYKYERAIKCELCGGQVYFDGDSTVDEYAIYMAMAAENLSGTLDELINDYLVYVCVNCGRKHKYTTKQVERFLRKSLTERALMLLINDMIDEKTFITDKYLIYCGKCQGLDGKGCCPRSIYDKCQIKRFPADGI